MRPQTIDVRESMGRILCCTIFRTGGKKLLSKGHVLSEDDVRLLEDEGMEQVWVTELEEGEVSEDDAVMQVAREVGCGCLEIRLAAGGRANLTATEQGCALVYDELLKQINCTASIVISTMLNFSHVKAGQRVATVKSAPFAIPKAQMEAVLSILKERGPLLQARPFRQPAVAVLYCDPINGDRARQLFENIMRQRLERFGIAPGNIVTAVEDEASLARALHLLVRTKPTGILIASTTAPAGPDDTVGRAMANIGCHLERFLAPVEPGNLFLLGYKQDIPVISAPGCFRSARPNVVDMVLPPVLARYRVSGWEIASLGHGGLLA
ncbi:MAG: molybdopterin-binding protein [Acidobacteria bacterium]|nr:molybdopterin-binding protein [Acidobacteriota bacterium]